MNSQELNEFSVSDDAFWHTNMDLYYGYQPGEVVEVEHESNKYWLATIKYSFRHLVLLKWVGDYGEFWVDTSQLNSTTSSSTVFSEFNTPKRLFPPGYHLQSQLKSQFTLERPTKVLVEPSLYNPANDPYADIKTIDDLLTHEIDQTKDAFGSHHQSSTNASEPASLVLAKCKTKISYGQEDVDELEAALQNLNEIDSNETGIRTDSPDGFNLTNELTNSNKLNEKSCNIESKPNLAPTLESPKPEIKKEPKEDLNKEDSSQPVARPVSLPSCNEPETKVEVDHQIFLDICKNLQESAISKGRYLGLGENSKKVYYLKPKLFFDMGGANHDRVFVPGTLLEICHTVETDSGLELCHWIAIVLRNVGGRLSLRWFLCDEPKFKQGRLELKSCKSQFIREDEDQDESDEGQKEENSGSSGSLIKIPVKSISFCVHFCDPCVHSISHAKTIRRPYKMPSNMRSSIEELVESVDINLIEKAQLDHVFDFRRMNLDKDRPIIDHLLSTARWMAPTYVNLTFASKDLNNRREILLSTPRTTKLLKGFVKREMEPGVFEINSVPLSENGEIIKFVYPYNRSYSILPPDWAVNNEDCLSGYPSRNTSPLQPENSQQPNGVPETQLEKPSEPVVVSCETGPCETGPATQEVKPSGESVCDVKLGFEPIVVGPLTLLCEISKNGTASDDRAGEDSLSKERPEDFDELEPSCWSRRIRAHEASAPKFQCNTDLSSKEFITSKFKVMDQLEVVHPSSDVTICLGRIRKVVYPLLWIQISSDAYTLLPFNSTDIYPSKWCETNNHPLVSLLPPRKRLNQSSSQPDKKLKKSKKESGNASEDDQQFDNQMAIYEKEHFDLGAINHKQSDIDYILNEKTMLIRIYFNHKCFTGPSLSKGKICSLPQYIGPGPLNLVMEEVVTKIISVAYVPPRILNDLSSQSFEELLTARNLTNTVPNLFKAKYQKRVHEGIIQVCINPDDVTLYCECVCEHLKCCYNLFGPNLYDGDDCPGHCRALTKSNKFMKRATYYREKARLGEFMNNDIGSSKKSSSNNSSGKTTRARYSGRDSSESTSSSLSRSEQLHSCTSSVGDEVPTNELKENLVAVAEMENEDDLKESPKDEFARPDQEKSSPTLDCDVISDIATKDVVQEVDKILHQSEQIQKVQNILINKPSPEWSSDIFSEFNMLGSQELHPESWSVDEVAEHLEWCRLGRFKPRMLSEVSSATRKLFMISYILSGASIKLKTFPLTRVSMVKL